MYVYPKVVSLNMVCIFDLSITESKGALHYLLLLTNADIQAYHLQ